MNVRLRNHFLIAMPGMEDSIFAHSITYLCEHNEHGAMGIVVNRPLELSFDDIFEHLEIPGFVHRHDQPVLAGGPVQTDRGFVLHRREKRWLVEGLHAELARALHDLLDLATSPLKIRSEISGELSMISTAATRPLPSFFGSRRCETSAAG
jgi:putative AlgH/UPF0301 family transcriptional regulator